MKDARRGGDGRIDLDELEKLLKECPAGEERDALKALVEVDPEAVEAALKKSGETPMSKSDPKKV